MKKILIGTVVSTALISSKTIGVKVETKFQHPMYGKVIKQHTKYLVHCENPSIQVGDKVAIQSSKKLSKRKNFILHGKLETNTN